MLEDVKKKKVLFVATMAHGHILSFHVPYLKMLKEMGCEVHVATGDEAEIPYCDKKYTLNIRGTKPINKKNIKGYFELKKVINSEQYDMIHCHTAVAAALTRLAAIESRKHGTKVLYTSHGNYYYKGGSILSWLLYYPLEKYLSKFTDGLIMINSEDYNLSLEKMKCKDIYHVHGVGIDINSIENIYVDNAYKRKEFQLDDETLLLISVGELSKNKNHITAIKAVKEIVSEGQIKLKYLICGEGSLYNYLNHEIKRMNLENVVELVGYRTDVIEIIKCSDIFIMPSFREGLPRSVMEAMACGVPIICSNARGNIDLVINNQGGLLHEPFCINELAKSICKLAIDQDTRIKMSQINKSNIGNYDIKIVKKEMKAIYEEYLNIEHEEYSY